MLTLHLSIIFLLIIVNGFFAMAEIALVASRKARLQPLAEVGNPAADAALELKADPSRLLATVQIGVTVIAILLGTFGQEMALRLGDRRASAVMTPRTRIESLDLDDPEEENRRKIRDSAYSRFPVVQGGSQQVIGIVQAKDLLIAALAGRPFDLRAATRSPLYLPNTVTVLRVLEAFKTSGEPMALVVDEYGDLEGLVTQSDILEALVGDIPGSAEADQRVVRREDGTCLIDGMVGLDELKQVLGISHLLGEDADFHTLGGYVMARLNRVPMVADRVTAAGYRFEVVKMDGRRVDRVLVSPVKTKGR